MSGAREIEGLPWPEGDPGALRGMALHADRLATQLASRQTFALGIGPMGWLGDARDVFTVSLAESSHALGTSAHAMHEANSALLTLAGAVHDGQTIVLAAAQRLKETRDAAVTATAHASTLRLQADQQAQLNSLLGPLGAVPAFPGQQSWETAAAHAETLAATARSHSTEVETASRRDAQAAFDDVQRADARCADMLEGLQLVQASGTSLPGAGPAASPALSALGILLFGAGANDDRSLKNLLSKPPPPPPPPPKPAKHHNWWKLGAAGALAVATAALTVADIAQLGLDPVTDGATAATATETAALAEEAIAGEAALAETVAGDAAAGETAAIMNAAEAAAVRPAGENSKLGNIVDNLFKGTTNPNRVGNGTTADAIRRELATGKPTGGRFHLQKGIKSEKALSNFLKRNPDASASDRRVAQQLLDELRSARGAR